MAEELLISEHLSKKEKYESLIPQIEGLVLGEKNIVANVANIMAALKQTFNFWWVGVYIVEDGVLVLGPFQGPVACTRINKGKGVCGASWDTKETLVVPNVDEFPGHIACSSVSKSEIVVPIYNQKNEVWGVIDVDSEYLNHFDEVDKLYLEKISSIIQAFIY